MLELLVEEVQTLMVGFPPVLSSIAEIEIVWNFPVFLLVEHNVLYKIKCVFMTVIDLYTSKMKKVAIKCL